MKVSQGKRLSVGLFIGLLVGGCRQNVLGSPNSAYELSYNTLQSPASAQGAFLGALTSFNNQVIGDYNDGIFLLSGLLSDELSVQASSSNTDQAAIDGRYTVYSETVNGHQIGSEDGDYVFERLLWARSQLLLVVDPLANYESDGTRSLAGEAYALAGYAEVYMAEDYCPGVTLDRALPGSGVRFGTPLTTDSLLGTAIGHFDSALTYAYQNDTVIYLASVGLGRAWLDRGQLGKADSAVANVPLSFVYSLASAPATNANSLSPNFWTEPLYEATQGNNPCAGSWNVADRDGGVGMNYVSAADFRLGLDSSTETCDSYWFGPTGTITSYGMADGPFYYPLKFGPLGQSTSIPIATGVEAALIAAEAAGSGGTTPGPMLTQLQALRQNAAQTYLQYSGTVPSTLSDSLGATGAEAVAILFRERAFWLYGMGARLGDMRREVRQYGTYLGANAVNLVYPNGPYGPAQISPSFDVSGRESFSLQNYGTDIDMPLPAPGSGPGQTYVSNPAYKGCTQSTTVP